MDKKTSIKINLLTIAVVVLFLIPMWSDFSLGFNVASELYGVKSEFAPIVSLEATDLEGTAEKIGDNVTVYTIDSSAVLSMKDTAFVPFWLKKLTSIATLLSFVVMVWCVVLIFRIISLAMAGGLISRKMVGRLRLFSGMLGGVSLLLYIVCIIETMYIRSGVQIPGYELKIVDIPSGIAISIVVLIISEIVRMQCKLEEEQELTI